MYCTLHTDIALIVLNKCLSIRSETVHYNFEFIEDHQKGEHVTSQGDGNEAAEVMELTDLTRTETTKGGENEERKREEEGEGVEDVDILWLNYHSKQCALDDGENFPPKWGPKGYDRSHHPLTLMVS